MAYRYTRQPGGLRRFMGIFLRNAHIILGFSLIALLLIVAIDLLMHQHYAEGGLLLAVADMYSYFIYVIIADRPWPR